MWCHNLRFSLETCNQSPSRACGCELFYLYRKKNFLSGREYLKPNSALALSARDTFVSMSMFQATGRSILVIGGLGGLGRGISSSFLHAGAHVIALDTHVENEASFRKELSSSSSQLSVICGDATQSEVYATAQEVANSRGHVVDTVVICATPPQFTNAIEDYDWDYHQQLIS